MEQPQNPEVRNYMPIIVNGTPKLDLESYIANYSGRTRYSRLALIGASSPVLRHEALRLAATEAKHGSDVKSYEDAVKGLQRIVKGGGTDGLLDMKWLKETGNQNEAETIRLERELKGYKNNLIKESIRMGNEDLGNHYLQIGDLNNATKAYSRMRDYCTTPAHIASTSFRIIRVAIEERNWLAVQSQVHKIRNLQMKTEEADRNQPKVQTAMGLYQMSTGEYREAAFSFLETPPSLGDSYNEVISSNDVAVYGGLCALASMDRHELQTKVLENANFRNFLELEPHIRRAINFFCASKYAQCLDILDSYRADYLLDIYLQPHVTNLYRRIRTKSIVQYFEPFSRVTLDAMAQTFGGSSSAAAAGEGAARIEDELIELIKNGTLEAKIDLEKRVLVAKRSILRADVHREALEKTKAYIREARLRLLRINAIGAGLEVKAPQRQNKGDMGGYLTSPGAGDMFQGQSQLLGGRELGSDRRGRY